MWVLLTFLTSSINKWTDDKKRDKASKYLVVWQGKHYDSEQFHVYLLSMQMSQSAVISDSTTIVSYKNSSTPFL